MDLRQMLLELLGSGPKPFGNPIMDRMMAGPTAPLAPKINPMDMLQGGYGATGLPQTIMPKTSPATMVGQAGPNLTVAPKNVQPGMQPGGMPPLPPGFGLGAAQGPMPQPGMGGFGPPLPPGLMGPMTVGTPPPAPPPGQQVASAAPGFRQQAGGLFGNIGKSLPQIILDALAGTAGVDPTAPGLTAFAQGATGAAGQRTKREESKRKRTTEEEDRAWEREGDVLNREGQRLEMSNTKQMAPLQRAKAAAEIKETLRPRSEKDLDSLVKASIERDELMTPEEKAAKWKEYTEGRFGQDGAAKWTPESGKPPPIGTRAKARNGNGWVEWNGEEWVDQDGNPVPTS